MNPQMERATADFVGWLNNQAQIVGLRNENGYQRLAEVKRREIIEVLETVRKACDGVEEYING